ncbi:MULTISPECIES: DUF1345 domain-containing protein [Alphaproteobacteria]|uniref:Membrane protein n=2 Tax=Alphaproteobacteria TaxID=28211 RepID=A0A512HHY0_9HYPH|nr:MULTISPECIES: DUF1345 domain-containing protein [Alphaproteobacteria]GEO85053.1 membrane protein [Ciceribacter naphthalenivorans]GLR22987.1 membrane protein [Ciceribacter naphthalenivorans]GLT05843.1 membrane protein [Sphingomonas psychrolutea]
MASLFNRLIAHRHGPFYAGLLTAAIAVLAIAFVKPQLTLEVGAVVFFLTYLFLIGLRLPRMSADYLRERAEEADEPAVVIMLVTLAAVVVVIVSLFRALNSGSGGDALELVLAFASVLGGWMTIHTMAAIHYGHLYWRPDTTAEKPENRGGLEFPGSPDPGGWDFLYFAFVIGMTAQTSDTAITSTAMRRINLIHSIVSYFFNTVLIAAAVNGAVALAG